MISSGDKLSDEVRYEPQADPSAMDTQVYSHRLTLQLWIHRYIATG
jgi:hypothetical protein